MTEILADLKSLMGAPGRRTLAVAESMTCGHLQANIGAISGASGFFLGGMTAYTVDQKVRHLGVRRVAARRVNSVSAGVAGEMSRGVCLFLADVKFQESRVCRFSSFPLVSSLRNQAKAMRNCYRKNDTTR